MPEQKKLTFEQALQELETIVQRLESGKVELSEAVQAYEKGMKLKALCEKELAQAKVVVDKLLLSQNKETPTGVEALDDLPH